MNTLAHTGSLHLQWLEMPTLWLTRRLRKSQNPIGLTARLLFLLRCAVR